MILCDQVVERAKGVWVKKHPDLVSRVEFVGGSFFPQGMVLRWFAAAAFCRTKLSPEFPALRLMRQHVSSFVALLSAGAVPAGKSAKDAYVMRVVLHDWNDEETTAILKNVRAAIGELTTTRLQAQNLRTCVL